VLGLKKLTTAPTAANDTTWTSLVWIQFRSKVSRNLSKEAICRLAENIGTIFDMELEGREKWGRFARIRVIIDPCLPLKDIITLNIPGGELEKVLIHYEKLYMICLFCAKIGHEMESCEDYQSLIAHINTYSLEIRGILCAKLKPSYGEWVHKDYCLPPCRETGGPAR
jgi:hypothetical protein